MSNCIKLLQPLCLVTVLLVCLSNGRRIHYFGGKIIGGRNAAVGEFPYQASLQRKYYFGEGAEHLCGGAIIDEYHILTAGHCVYGQFQAQLRIVAGTLNISDTSNATRVNLTIAQIYLHEDFVYETLLNDIALIRVDGNFPLNSPEINAIPLRSTELLPPATCTVTGWGNTREVPNNRPDILQALDMPLVSQDVCVSCYKDDDDPDGGILPGMFCAGYLAGGKDACDGDSGGPLACGGLLTGIVSGGNDCALPNFPGVYSNVSYFKDWIQTNLAKSFSDGGLTGPLIF